MKSILVHVQSDSLLVDRLETAMSLARSCGGHVSCLHVTPADAFVAFDAFGGVHVMADMVQAIEEQAVELRTIVSDQFANEDVSWDYEQASGPLVGTLASRAALSDALVVSRRPPGSPGAGESLATLGDLLHQIRTPLLIPGTAAKAYDPTGPLLVGWDGNYEAANAVRAAMPLMRRASSVHIVRVEDSKEAAEGLFPSTRLLEYLSRHDIHAELIVEPAGTELAASALLGRAAILGAQTLVIGGYGHSRIGEYLFGGVTRNLLEDCPIALLIAH